MSQCPSNKGNMCAEYDDQLRLPIHSSRFSPACVFALFADRFSVCEWVCECACEFSCVKTSPLAVVFLLWGRVLVGRSRLSSFFMGVAYSSSFCFLRAVNSSKKMRSRLILDSPSMVLPWKDSRFLRTRRVLVAGSSPAYSASSWSMKSSSSRSFISMEASQSTMQFFRFFSVISSTRIRSIFFIRYAYTRTCYYNSRVSVSIQRSERTAARVGSRMIAFPFACTLASAALFLRPRAARTVEQAYRSSSCSPTMSECETQSVPSKARPISRIAASKGTFWLRSSGGSTSPTAPTPTAPCPTASASSTTATTESMKLGAFEYSTSVDANRSSFGWVMTGEGETVCCCGGRLIDQKSCMKRCSELGIVRDWEETGWIGVSSFCEQRAARFFLKSSVMRFIRLLLIAFATPHPSSLHPISITIIRQCPFWRLVTTFPPSPLPRPPLPSPPVLWQ